jgi:hypothetical protein
MLKRMKDELGKYKIQAAKLHAELENAQRIAEQSSNQISSAPATWEQERADLHKSLFELQDHMSSSITNLGTQITKLKEDLKASQSEKEQDRADHEAAKQDLLIAIEKTQADLEQLKRENSLLESRALDAEHKVSMLLDQVEASVGNYRRQSQNGQGINGLSRSHSAASSTTVSGISGRPRADSNMSHDDSFLIDNRSSLALDSLANELESLRSHWESNNRSYRLSNTFDLERTPTKDSGDGAVLSDSLASWRRRLDEEETRASSPTTVVSEKKIPNHANPLIMAKGGNPPNMI